MLIRVWKYEFKTRFAKIIQQIVGELPVIKVIYKKLERDTLNTGYKRGRNSENLMNP